MHNGQTHRRRRKAGRPDPRRRDGDGPWLRLQHGNCAHGHRRHGRRRGTAGTPAPAPTRHRHRRHGATAGTAGTSRHRRLRDGQAVSWAGPRPAPAAGRTGGSTGGHTPARAAWPATGGTAGMGGNGGAGGPANLPPTLNVPAGATLKLHLHATGDQVYTCTASTAGGRRRRAGGAAAAATTYSWVLKQPDAKLYDASNTQVGTHGWARTGPPPSTAASSTARRSFRRTRRPPARSRGCCCGPRRTRHGRVQRRHLCAAREHDRGRGALDRLRLDDGRHGHAGRLHG